jgi:hypothetical protein
MELGLIIEDRLGHSLNRQRASLFQICLPRLYCGTFGRHWPADRANLHIRSRMNNREEFLSGYDVWRRPKPIYNLNDHSSIFIASETVRMAM